MKKLFILFCGLIIASCLSGQDVNTLPRTKVMTLGVFHFSYPNLDHVKTEKSDQISILEEPYQSEIISICKAIEEFKPTIIAVEARPGKQHLIDSLYSLYKSGKLVLEKDERNQLGFRIGRDLDLPKIYCVDDPGRNYENIVSMFNDTVRLSRMSDFYTDTEDTIYIVRRNTKKASSVIDALFEMNTPENIKESLANYLLIPFKYEETPGDFTGVDFESGRWFNRNLRIFRNIQRIPHDSNDRILVIFGAGHLNLLNPFFDISNEYELISPLPYLEKARSN